MHRFNEVRVLKDRSRTLLNCLGPALTADYTEFLVMAWAYRVLCQYVWCLHQ